MANDDVAFKVVAVDQLVASDIYIVEQEMLTAFIASAKSLQLDESRVVLLSGFEDHYNLSDFPLAMTIVKLSLPVRLNALQRVLASKTIDAAKVGEPAVELLEDQADEIDQDKILIVEDNETNRHVIVSMLKKLGYQPDVAFNGVEAVEKVAENDYALIFMDCQMPVMDGYVATEEIRKMDKGERPRVNIIAMTGNAMEGDKEKCLNAGMDDYIAKPVRLSMIKETLREWIPPA